MVHHRKKAKKSLELDLDRKRTRIVEMKIIKKNLNTIASTTTGTGTWLNIVYVLSTVRSSGDTS